MSPSTGTRRTTSCSWSSTTSLATLVLLGSGLVKGAGPPMIILHGVMLPTMFVTMLYRRDEYSCAHREATA